MLGDAALLTLLSECCFRVRNDWLVMQVFGFKKHPVTLQALAMYGDHRLARRYVKEFAMSLLHCDAASMYLQIEDLEMLDDGAGPLGGPGGPPPPGAGPGPGGHAPGPGGAGDAPAGAPSGGHPGGGGAPGGDDGHHPGGGGGGHPGGGAAGGGDAPPPGDAGGDDNSDNNGDDHNDDPGHGGQAPQISEAAPWNVFQQVFLEAEVLGPQVVQLWTLSAREAVMHRLKELPLDTVYSIGSAGGTAGPVVDLFASMDSVVNPEPEVSDDEFDFGSDHIAPQSKSTPKIDDPNYVFFQVAMLNPGDRVQPRYAHRCDSSPLAVVKLDVAEFDASAKTVELHLESTSGKALDPTFFFINSLDWRLLATWSIHTASSSTGSLRSFQGRHHDKVDKLLHEMVEAAAVQDSSGLYTVDKSSEEHSLLLDLQEKHSIVKCSSSTETHSFWHLTSLAATEVQVMFMTTDPKLLLTVPTQAALKEPDDLTVFNCC